jgi:hypothetical protein
MGWTKEHYTKEQAKQSYPTVNILLYKFTSEIFTIALYINLREQEEAWQNSKSRS